MPPMYNGIRDKCLPKSYYMERFSPVICAGILQSSMVYVYSEWELEHRYTISIGISDW